MSGGNCFLWWRSYIAWSKNEGNMGPLAGMCLMSSIYPTCQHAFNSCRYVLIRHCDSLNVYMPLLLFRPSWTQANENHFSTFWHGSLTMIRQCSCHLQVFQCVCVESSPRDGGKESANTCLGYNKVYGICSPIWRPHYRWVWQATHGYSCWKILPTGSHALASCVAWCHHRPMDDVSQLTFVSTSLHLIEGCHHHCCKAM